MTMPFSPSKAVYSGNGVTVDFPFAFRVWKTSQLEVSVTDPQGMVQAVAGWTANITSTGGTVTYRKDGAPLPTGWKLAVLRNMPFEQNIDLISGTRFDPEVVERRLDEDAAERQQLKEAVDRSIKVPPTSQDPPELLTDKIFEARDQAAASAVASEASADMGETRQLALPVKPIAPPVKQISCSPSPYLPTNRPTNRWRQNIRLRRACSISTFPVALRVKWEWLGRTVPKARRGRVGKQGGREHRDCKGRPARRDRLRWLTCLLAAVRRKHRLLLFLVATLRCFNG